MHFSAAYAAVFAFALGVAAHGGPPSIHQAKNQCGGASTACCLSKDEIHADGILSGLLARGLLSNVLGSSGQACAKNELIENLNLLGFTKQGQNGQSCKGATACCPEGSDSCHHV